MTQEALADVVGQQAAARIRGDDAWFAAWMTPQAILQLRAAPRSARSARVLDVSVDGDAGRSEVRYTSWRESYMVEQRWLLTDGAWRCVSAACAPERRRLTLIGRVASIFGRAPAAVPQTS